MKNPKQQVSQSRRRFLRDAGVAGGVATVTATAPGVALSATAEAGDDKKPDEGYRLTKHILDYYKSVAG